MLNFEQQIKNRNEKKAFYELNTGNFFVWDEKPNTLCLKITNTCYLNTSTNYVYTVCDDADSDSDALGVLDISYDCCHGQSNVVLDVKIEDCTIKWSVVR